MRRKAVWQVFLPFAVVATFANAGQQTFEVASIKPNNSGDARSSISVQPGGRFLASNIGAKSLVSFAYQMEDYQVVGGPSWLTSTRFDVVAKAPTDIPIVPTTAGGPPSSWQLMMRALLAERFRLTAHTDTREMPVLNLVVARNDGRLGRQLQRSTADCSSLSPRPPGAPAPDPNERPTCGMRLAPGAISAGGRSMAGLAGTLTQFVQRPVTDRTNLSGLFDFDLQWAYEPTNAITAQLAVPVDPDSPPLFTALQEQLGLRLDAARAPIPVLVIDSIERPTPD